MTAAFPLFPKESLLLLSFGTHDCLCGRSCLGQHPRVPDNVNVFVPRNFFFFFVSYNSVLLSAKDTT